MSEVDTSTSETLTDEQLTAAFPGQDLEHIRSMMGKMDGTEQPDDAENTAADSADGAENSDTVQYPEYIPEKFRSGTVEEAHKKMADSYRNLESKLGSRPQTSSDDDTDENSEDTDSQTLTLKDVGEEFLKNDGVISAETYKAFESKGFSKSDLDLYIAGQQAIANQLVTKAYTEAGGQQQYSDMVKWAESNWSEAEIVAFDSIVGGTDEAAIRVAVRGLKASYRDAEGVNPKLLEGDSGQPAGNQGYQSKKEMTTDMKNPKYRTDPAFRKMVEQKIAKSNIW